jgi:hypothetical protein
MNGEGGIMSRIIAIISAGLFVLAVTAGSARSQSIINNPAKPDNPRAGRVVTLEEVMRIDDTGADFYIKNVYGLAVGRDGSIFVQDEQKRILRFDARGRFLGSIIETGQGPGEVSRINGLVAGNDELGILTDPPKVSIRDRGGKLIQDISLGGPRGMIELIALTEEAVFFGREEPPNPKSPGSGAATVLQRKIQRIPRSGGSPELIAAVSIPARIEFFPQGARGIRQHSRFQTEHVDGSILMVAQAMEYRVDMFDAQARKLVASFRRPYKKVKAQGGGNLVGPGGSLSQPSAYIHDITDVYAVDGHIWVKTSAVDAKRGILFDVYDKSGRYIDCFFLKPKPGETSSGALGYRFVFSEGFVYFSDRTEDDLVVIRKCRMVGL